MSRQSWARMMSEPVSIHWCGWKSDTWALQRNGWELSADQNVMEGTMRIAMRHRESGMVGLTQACDWRYFERAEAMRYMQLQVLPEMRIESIAPSHRVLVQYRAGAIPFREFAPIDAQPCYVQMEPFAQDPLEELVHFASFQQKRILLPEDTVADLMDRILKLQEPARQARFLEEAKDARQSGLELKAQILSFPGR